VNFVGSSESQLDYVAYLLGCSADIVDHVDCPADLLDYPADIFDCSADLFDYSADHSGDHECSWVPWSYFQVFCHLTDFWT
jgi:hypothetical protein